MNDVDLPTHACRTGRHSGRPIGVAAGLCSGAVALAVPPAMALLARPALAGERRTDDVLTALRADDAAVVARGETVYATHCANCYGAALEGEPDWRSRDADGLLPAPPHDATGHTWHHADDLLFEIVKYGPAEIIGVPDYRSLMPIYAGVLDGGHRRGAVVHRLDLARARARVAA